MLNEKYGINHVSYLQLLIAVCVREEKVKNLFNNNTSPKKIYFLLRENNIKKIFINNS